MYVWYQDFGGNNVYYAWWQAGSKLVQLTAVLARPSGAEVGGTAASKSRAPQGPRLCCSLNFAKRLDGESIFAKKGKLRIQIKKQLSTKPIFGSKWIPDETSGQAGRLKRMAYGSSSYELFGENMDLTCILQSTFRILRKTMFFI